MTNFWDDAPAPDEDFELQIQGVALAPDGEGQYRVILRTSRGEIAGQLTACEGGTGAAIFVGGAAGGLEGPAQGLYPRLAEALAGRRVSSLRLHYRHPLYQAGEGQMDDAAFRRVAERRFVEGVLDVLAGVSFLKGVGAERIALVGHSFGGGVVIRAGSLSPLVHGVAALASQTFGTQYAEDLSPRSLLLVHGMEDSEFAAAEIEEVYRRAAEPKRLVIYAGAGHGLVHCQAELYDLLVDWIPVHALPPEPDA